jgi:hypothetical protein
VFTKKSPAFVPLKVSAVSWSELLDELEMVKNAQALQSSGFVVAPIAAGASVALVGEKIRAGAAVATVPLREIECGLPGALSAKLSVAVRVPVAEAAGLKVT